jgi:hypothetical protein
MWQVLSILGIYDKIKESRVPAKVAYKFNKLCLALNNDAEFYRTELNKIVQQYGEKNEDGSFVFLDGGSIKIKAEVYDDAKKEINNLDGLEVDAPDIKFTVDELDGLQLSIEDFNRMLPFIED